MDNHERVAVTGNADYIECPTCGSNMVNMGGVFGMYEFVCYGSQCDSRTLENAHRNKKDL